MTALVTDSLHLLAGAPNGMSALRGLILDLALRGKLTCQDASDEPATELLGQIHAERAGLVAAGSIRKAKDSPTPDADSMPFGVPNGWEWASLASLVVQITDGTHHTPTYLPSGIPFISVKDIDGKTVEFGSCKYISPQQHAEINARCNPELGDILLCRIGTLGRPTIVDTNRPFSIFVSVGLLKLPKLVQISRYLHAALSSPFLYRQYDQIKAGGSHTNKLNLGDIPQLMVPVPPLAEQHRIVAKVDELMALCDRLEAEQADAEAAHAKLVEALLASLTQARDAADFRASWQQLAEHFHTLFTTDASVDALKQTVLTLALKGLLTHQDADGQSGADLVAEVNQKRMAQAASGRLRSVDAAEPADRAEVPYSFPASWGLARISELCEPITSGTTPPSSEMDSEAGVPFLKVYNIRNQRIDFSYKPQFVNPEYNTQKMGRSSLKPLDVVMNIVGPPLGKVAIIPEDYPAWNCNQAIVFFRAIPPISHRYLYLFLCEGSFLKGIELIGTAGQDNISVTKSRNIPVPVPPVLEQHRIVAKVDELLDICDQLKVNIANARQRHEHLAAVLVEQAVS